MKIYMIKVLHGDQFDNMDHIHKAYVTKEDAQAEVKRIEDDYNNNQPRVNEILEREDYENLTDEEEELLQKYHYKDYRGCIINEVELVGEIK